MQTLTHQQFDVTVRQVLQDYNIPDIEKKLKSSGELRFLLSTINNLFAYQAWNKNTISTFLTKQAISSKNLDTFIKSYIAHLDAVMNLCDFRYTDKRSYFSLYAIRFALHIFVVKKQFLLNSLHKISFDSWTDPIHYNNPFELIRKFFLDTVDIASFFDDDGSDFSLYKEDFAKNFLKMQTFFYTFNITEKRIKTSFSIQVYQSLCNLSLSKYKTKEITDTIMHHLDIDTTINLRKIDNIYCIGKMDIHKIYGYDAPLIPIKFLDTESIRSIQMKHKQEALEANNHELVDQIDTMMEHFRLVAIML